MMDNKPRVPRYEPPPLSDRATNMLGGEHSANGRSAGLYGEVPNMATPAHQPERFL